MTCELQKDSMDSDISGESQVSPFETKQNGFHLYPVSVNDSGEGLPYSPENWPNPGDKWSWKVGKRIGVSGHFLDRYVFLPNHLRAPGQGRGFASRLSLEQYVRGKFPNTDIHAFFASFSWRVPSKNFKKGNKETTKHPESDSPIDELHCKAGNRLCSSLTSVEDSIPEIMFCDICCSEPGFCRYCSCILCCNIIDKSCGGYNYIKCEANIEGYICGHSSHINCALRAYMAGTVGGSIGLEAEFYCRRCDSRTDLVSHVAKLLETCESINSRDDVEKILSIGICVLRGSKKMSAERLLRNIELAMNKLKNGMNLEDIWKKEQGSAVTPVGVPPNANGESVVTKHEEHQETVSPQSFSLTFDPRIESLKLENEIEHVLLDLRKSQEIEYTIAEERLFAHRNYILNLYQQFDKERSDLSCHASTKEDQNLLLDALLSRIGQIKREISRLKAMEEIAKGFGRVPKHILKEQFDVDIEN